MRVKEPGKRRRRRVAKVPGKEGEGLVCLFVCLFVLYGWLWWFLYWCFLDDILTGASQKRGCRQE
jgi:hypothetical protein